MGTATAIRVRDLTKRYEIGTTSPTRLLRQALRPAHAGGDRDGSKSFWALRDVSFDLQQGEVLGILGRNGAGKSTLLKVLSRIIEPTAGQAEIHGRVGSLLEVGTGFHPELTGRENIYLNGAILGMRRAEIRGKFDEIVEFSEIGEFIDTPVKRYSSGMYTRLAFSVAAHLQTEVLIVDEVLAVGDASFQRKCMGKMNAAAQQGKTVLFVSHNMGTIADLCTRCLMLSSGRLVDDNKPAEVIARYLRENANSKSSVNFDEFDGERRFNGPMRLRQARIEDAAGRECSHFAWGQPLSVRFSFDGRAGNGCIVGIAISNSAGVIAMHLSNVDDRAELPIPSAQSQIVMNIPQLMLNDGRYYVNIWLGDELNQLNDVARRCLSFEIDSTAQGAFRSQGIFRQQATWQVAPATNEPGGPH